ncbi:hypothetical protein VTL71DRAFT_11869 [Oculimacula yallundae]|uniref:Uncharacterized protein n=1 Tax=Oculimacula yallundae TaxID=86028 RepID=A0ABR4CTP9_9HELO
MIWAVWEEMSEVRRHMKKLLGRTNGRCMLSEILEFGRTIFGVQAQQVHWHTIPRPGQRERDLGVKRYVLYDFRGRKSFGSLLKWRGVTSLHQLGFDSRLSLDLLGQLSLANHLESRVGS